MQGFALRKHPCQACSLDCIVKLRFAFQPAFAGRCFKKTAASSKLPSGLTGQHASALILFHFTPKKNRGQPAKPIPLYFNYNSNPSISFAISFTALLAVQSVYSSAQATQWSYINATRSPVSLILALISAIFFSSSFFNPF